MSETLEKIKTLVAAGKVRVTEHGQEELFNDSIMIDELMASIGSAVLVEDYPDAYKGSSILVLQQIEGGKDVHVVWGITITSADIASLITAYFPNPDRWYNGFMKRKPR